MGLLKCRYKLPSEEKTAKETFQEVERPRDIVSIVEGRRRVVKQDPSKCLNEACYLREVCIFPLHVPVQKFGKIPGLSAQMLRGSLEGRKNSWERGKPSVRG